MTILFFTRLFHPHIGGVERHVERVSQELIKLGHEVIVVTEQYQQKLKEVEKRKSIKVYRIPVGGVSEKAKKWHIWRWLWQHRSLISQADIIHVHDVFFWYLPFRFLFPQKPVFITLHGYETKFPPATSAIFQKRLAAKLTSANICVGDYIGKWYGIKPTLVTYGATDQKRLPLPKKPHVLVLGRPSKDNNIQEVRQALKRVKHIPVTHSLKTASIVIASSYLSILEALAAGRPVISLYSNPLKRDYLLGLNRQKIVTWDKICQLYLHLWQK